VDEQSRQKLEELSDRGWASHDADRDDRQARDDAMYESWAAGSNYRELADATGLTVARCHQVVTREHARRQVIEADGEPVGPAVG